MQQSTSQPVPAFSEFRLVVSSIPADESNAQGSPVSTNPRHPFTFLCDVVSLQISTSTSSCSRITRRYNGTWSASSSSWRTSSSCESCAIIAKWCTSPGHYVMLPAVCCRLASCFRFSSWRLRHPDTCFSRRTWPTSELWSQSWSRCIPCWLASLMCARWNKQTGKHNRGG